MEAVDCGTMKTTYGTKINKILSIYDNVALCQCGCELVHIHTSNIIGLKQ